MMDVFRLRDQVISEYRGYSEGFVKIADERIQGTVNDAYDKGLLWPDPRIGLNPSFEPGATVDELVGSGRLHPLAEEIFRKDKSADDPRGKPMTLHRHQAQAIDAAADGRSYVLTTGTGSGKSLAYIVPIVDHVLRAGSGRGIKALVLYPMNALANSQYEELGKFLDHGPWTAENDGAPTAPAAPNSRRSVSFAVFTGQQSEDERRAIRDSPPDILLTNYVMAELILTRYNDIKLVNAMASLRFLVLDELHTYRGRQGADVAMLVRRIREACGATRTPVRRHVRDSFDRGNPRRARHPGGRGRLEAVRHRGPARRSHLRDAATHHSGARRRAGIRGGPDAQRHRRRARAD